MSQSTDVMTAKERQSDGPSIGLVIDGQVIAGEDPTYPVRNPARPAEVVLEAPAASAGQLDRAVAAARRAQPAWAALGVEERAARLRAAAAAAAARLEPDGVAELLTREHGKVLWEATFDSSAFTGMVAAFEPFVAEALIRRTLTPSGGGAITEVESEPFGVVAAMLPYNWPVAILGNKAIPALLAGNTVVAKTPPSCPAAVLTVGAAFAAELPPGVLNVLSGPGADLGAALVAHPGIDMVSFTGGVPTGQRVMAAAADRLRPLVLELGGNDAAIIAPDQPIDDMLAGRIFDAAFVTSGQVCMAIKRLLVPEAQVGAAVQALVDRVGKEVVGDGLASEVTMGPVHRPEGRDHVERLLADARARGARVHQPARLRDEDVAAGGYFVSPAIVEGAPRDAAVVVEEQFGPALPVLGYRDLDEAVAMANDTPFGLCASVWTTDRELGAAVARRLQAGTVFVNQHGMSAMDHRAPFGGWKNSGYGLELGVEGMRAFTRPRVVLTAAPATG